MAPFCKDLDYAYLSFTIRVLPLYLRLPDSLYLPLILTYRTEETI